MLERTKKRRTDKTVVLTFQGPESNRQAAVDFLSRLGFVDTSDTVPWREAFQDISEEEGPAVVLRAMRRREGLTQKALSEKADIPQGHISAMERGKMPIGVARAKKLAKALNAGYKVFL
ncbi:Helix-turn-helix motif [Desulfosarcina cetonica]|uniref:helix-turn-helix domain-containing protein n=1 Tax=Desulfosarcina cetonica TaxID=90730 RepID=UPI0006D0F0A3|nr:helix-turn-helix transcriptional regulator [Desulfosarcina cetonica]VTR66767.1 Helix-turn-helix motif [Desulfosarcina cetonica]